MAAGDASCEASSALPSGVADARCASTAALVRGRRAAGVASACVHGCEPGRHVDDGGDGTGMFAGAAVDGDGVAPAFAADSRAALVRGRRKPGVACDCDLPASCERACSLRGSGCGVAAAAGGGADGGALSGERGTREPPGAAGSPSPPAIPPTHAGLLPTSAPPSPSPGALASAATRLRAPSVRTAGICAAGGDAFSCSCCVPSGDAVCDATPPCDARAAACMLPLVLRLRFGPGVATTAAAAEAPAARLPLAAASASQPAAPLAGPAASARSAAEKRDRHSALGGPSASLPEPGCEPRHALRLRCNRSSVCSLNVTLRARASSSPLAVARGVASGAAAAACAAPVCKSKCCAASPCAADGARVGAVGAAAGKRAAEKGLLRLSASAGVACGLIVGEHGTGFTVSAAW